MLWREMTQAERVAEITRLFAVNPDLSASNIAVELHASKNAVIGYIVRHGIVHPAARGTQRAQMLNRLRNPPRRPERRPQRPRKVKPVVPDFPAAPPAMDSVWKALPGTTPVSLVDLPRHGCKWPIGDPHEPGFGYCGQPRDGERVYCAAHAKIAYRPIPEKVA